MRTPSHVIAQDGTRLAYYAIPAKEGTKRPGIVFLGGFMSSMTGNKATALEAWAKKNGYAFLRYDYCGHGSSGGSIENGTISRWVEDSITIINFVRDTIEGLGGPLILVGSSMGAWIMIHVALAFEENKRGQLKINYDADITVLSNNILTVPHEEILDTKILYTIVNGKIVYLNNNY